MHYILLAHTSKSFCHSVDLDILDKTLSISEWRNLLLQKLLRTHKGGTPSDNQITVSLHNCDLPMFDTQNSSVLFNPSLSFDLHLKKSTALLFCPHSNTDMASPTAEQTASQRRIQTERSYLRTLRSVGTDHLLWSLLRSAMQQTRNPFLWFSLINKSLKSECSQWHRNM